jgi:hypothetical protein
MQAYRKAELEPITIDPGRSSHSPIGHLGCLRPQAVVSGLRVLADQ